MKFSSLLNAMDICHVLAPSMDRIYRNRALMLNMGIAHVLLKILA